MQERFLKDEVAILESIHPQGNPFNPTQKNIINIYTHEQALNSLIIYMLEDKATQLFEDYLQEVFLDSSQAIYVEIKQNIMDIFGTNNVKKDKKKKQNYSPRKPAAKL